MSLSEEGTHLSLKLYRALRHRRPYQMQASRPSKDVFFPALEVDWVQHLPIQLQRHNLHLQVLSNKMKEVLA